MTYEELMKTLKICSVGNATDCDECPLHRSSDCHTIMARNALAELETSQIALKSAFKTQGDAKHHDTLETVKLALDKGGYSVTVDPDGEVRVMPWGETARWIKADNKDDIWHCSACGYHFGSVCKTYKFCPKCGAAMENDDEDD